MKRLCGLLLIGVVLAGCSMPSAVTPTVEPGLAFTQAAQTLSAELTRMAYYSTPFATDTPLLPTATPIVVTATPALGATSAPPAPPPVTRCDWVGFVSDITVPDGSSFLPSTPFTKTWRLKNIGTCTWTTAYKLVFHQGDAMGGTAINLPANVAPGQTIDLSINLVAPPAAGHYRGYWMLQNAAGVKFGIGAQANLAFWVDINVTGTGATTTTITTDTPDPSVPGQAVTVSVTVTGSGASPTGTVVITGADVNCTITLAGGSGSCTVTFHTVGTKTITATYSGDASNASSSDTESHTVQKGNSTTTITADTPDPSGVGASITVSVTVSGAGATPTGLVLITGADTTCFISLSGGSGSCSVVFNTAGSKTLYATYSGDANYNGSGDTESHTVKYLSTTTITGDVPNPSTPGQSVAIGVQVTGSGATPTGTVTISGADVNCTITLAAGSGSCNIVFNTTGSKTITATYSGDANYAPSSATKAHSVVLGPSTLTITAHTPDPSVVGQSVTVSVTVSGAGAMPTGTVAITGADINCNITLAGGSGSCNIVFNTVGSKTITATYSGDMNYSSSTANTTHTVNQGTTITTITSDLPDPSALGAVVTITVVVSGAGATPTGTVTITFAGPGAVSDGPTNPCSAGITLVGGTGSCQAIFNTIGSYTITASYGGDANYLPSTDDETHQAN